MDDENAPNAQQAPSQVSESVGEDLQLPPQAVANPPAEPSTLSGSAGVSVEAVTEPVDLKLKEHLRRQRHARRLTAPQIEDIYQDWLKNPKLSVAKRSTKFDIADSTLTLIMTKGSKRHKMAPFKERKFAEEALRAEAGKTAVDRIAEHLVDDWQKARDDTLKVTTASKAITAHLLKRFQESIINVRYTKTRRRKLDDGNYVDVEQPMDGNEAAGTARTLMQAFDLITRIESLWLGGPTDRIDHTSSQRGWMSLNEEQLQFVIDHDGELPAGVDEETIFGRKLVAIDGGRKT